MIACPAGPATAGTRSPTPAPASSAATYSTTWFRSSHGTVTTLRPAAWCHMSSSISGSGGRTRTVTLSVKV
ncbi:hypothetical protein ACFFX0_02575 [Citricoccus parietis]|uniref:Ig-like domain-containing protein n=1 Tax=Citricoccus parietis TaxID=592307 RepID=A0ABV5FU25_9MICC